MTPLVRTATPADAEAACAVIRRSIAESCIEDHDRDPTVLATWLANKTPEVVRSWIASPDAFGVVAECDGAIVGFAMRIRDADDARRNQPLLLGARGSGARDRTRDAHGIGERGRPPQPRRAYPPKHGVRSQVLSEVGVRRLWSSAAGPLHHGTAHAQGAEAVATERLTCSWEKLRVRPRAERNE